MLRETTSRGLCGLVYPLHTCELGPVRNTVLKTGSRPVFLSFKNRTQNFRVAGALFIVFVSARTNKRHHHHEAQPLAQRESGARPCAIASRLHFPIQNRGCRRTRVLFRPRRFPHMPRHGMGARGPRATQQPHNYATAKLRLCSDSRTPLHFFWKKYRHTVYPAHTPPGVYFVTIFKTQSLCYYSAQELTR